jgi:hypothetical protein
MLLVWAGATALLSAACIQVGPKDDEPIHIVLDVNIRVQIDQAVTDFWDSVERQAGSTTPEEQP